MAGGEPPELAAAIQQKGAQNSGGHFGSLRGGLAGDRGPHSPPHSPLALSPFPQRITVISPAQAPQVLRSPPPWARPLTSWPSQARFHPFFH